MKMKGSYPGFHSFGAFLQEKRKLFFGFILLFVTGACLGAYCSAGFLFSAEGKITPFLTSGIPAYENSFFLCFSTVLLDAALGWFFLFLMGYSLLGVVLVPLVLFIRGWITGVRISLILSSGPSASFLRHVLFYLPVLTALTFCLILYATLVFSFSRSLCRGLLSGEQNRKLSGFGRTSVVILVFLLLFSLAGAVPSWFVS